MCVCIYIIFAWGISSGGSTIDFSCKKNIFNIVCHVPNEYYISDLQIAVIMLGLYISLTFKKPLWDQYNQLEINTTERIYGCTYIYIYRFLKKKKKECTTHQFVYLKHKLLLTEYLRQYFFVTQKNTCN